MTGVRRTAAWGVVALGLVAIVAMEAHGAAWSKGRNAHGSGEVRSLPHAVIVAGMVCAAVLAFALFLLALVRSRAAETPEHRRRRWAAAIAVLVVLGVARLLVRPSHATRARARPAAPVTGRPGASSSGGGHQSDATWWPLVIVGLGTAAAFVAATARRSGVRPAIATTDDATIALLDASLDDLRTEPDARRAVVASYARMERGLAAAGFARQPAETPTEYLRRALTARTGGFGLAVEPLAELTELAERARFSVFAIDETMRSRAIAALETLRDDLAREGLGDLGRVG